MMVVVSRRKVFSWSTKRGKLWCRVTVGLHVAGHIAYHIVALRTDCLEEGFTQTSHILLIHLWCFVWFPDHIGITSISLLSLLALPSLIVAVLGLICHMCYKNLHLLPFLLTDKFF